MLCAIWILIQYGFLISIILTYYHGTWHNLTLHDINPRNTVDRKGGLCGMAALYWALTDTFLTPSQVYIP